MSKESDLLAVSTDSSRPIYQLFNPPWEYGMDRDKSRASGSYWVPDEFIDKALTVIGGTSESFTLFGQQINRIVPLRHPKFTGLLASNVRAVGAGHNHAKGGNGGYDGWKVAIEWATPNYDMSGDQAFMEFSGNAAVRQLMAGSSAMQFGDGSHPILDQAMEVGGADFTLTLHRIPTLNLSIYLALANTCNAGPFFGMPANTVLFHGPNWHRQTTVGMVTTWEISLAFSVTNPTFPWNYEFKRDGTLSQQFYGGTTNLRYPPSNLNLLFAA